MGITQVGCEDVFIHGDLEGVHGYSFHI